MLTIDQGPIHYFKFWLNLVENWLKNSQNSACKLLRVEQISGVEEIDEKIL